METYITIRPGTKIFSAPKLAAAPLNYGGVRSDGVDAEILEEQL